MVVRNNLTEIRMTKYMMDQKSFAKMIGISNTTYVNKMYLNVEVVQLYY